MTKRQILFRIGNLGGGGAEKVLITILKHFDRNKFEVDLLLHRLTGVYLNEVPDDVGLYYLGKGEEHLGKSIYPKFIERKIEKKKDKWLKANVKYIYSHLLKKNYDVEVAFLHDLMPIVANSPTTKKIGWVHNDLACKDYLTTNQRAKIINSSTSYDKIICVSHQALKSFVAMGGDATKATVIYNPIDRDEINSKSKEIENQLDKSVVNIVAIGRLHPQKRYDRLLESLNLLHSKGISNFHLYILGEGEQKNKLERICEDLRLTTFVTFLGFVQNPYAVIKQADIYVMSSDYEGFSLTIAESMLLHKPIVSTKVTGPIELLNDGELGMLVDRNPEALSDALTKFIKNESLRQEYAGRLQNANFPFDKDKIMVEVENVLLSV